MRDHRILCTDLAPTPEQLNMAALRPDCSACKGLCCILFPFDADQGFGFDKAAATACPNLDQQFRCRIHATLAEQGFSGCCSYDCHGAGQYVTAVLGLGADWHCSAETLAEAYQLFSTVKTKHALLRKRSLSV